MFFECTCANMRARAQIDATEDFLKLQRSIARNNLWKVDIVFVMITMWIAVGLFFSGAGGVNIKIGGEDVKSSPYDDTSWHDCGNCSEGACVCMYARRYAEELFCDSSRSNKKLPQATQKLNKI